MSQRVYSTTANHPLVSLLYLVLLALGGALVFTALGALVGAAIYGFPDNLLSGGADITSNSSLGFMKVLQIFSSTGLFLMPPIILSLIESKRPFHWLKLDRRITAIVMGLTLLLMFAGTPFLELIVQVNRSMKLPGFLQELEAWMLAKEKQMEVLTKQLLVMRNPADLMLNLFMIAILPAISEELFFRGSVQRLFTSWIKSHHAGIWIAAIIFSAIHIQFYGFFPRMLLGALFGYLLVWSGNMWYPIIAHFVNNGVTVVAAYIYQQQGKSLDELDSATKTSWPVYLLSAAAIIVLLFVFKRKATTFQDEPDGE
jgi:uncharacterized protein